MLDRRNRILHFRRGVKHLNKRCIPISFEQLRGPSGEPVVGMNNVVADALLKRIESGLRGKFRQVLKEIVLIDGGRWTCGDVDEVYAVADFNSFQRSGISSSSKYVNWETETSEM